MNETRGPIIACISFAKFTASMLLIYFGDVIPVFGDKLEMLVTTIDIVYVSEAFANRTPCDDLKYL